MRDDAILITGPEGTVAVVQVKSSREMSPAVATAWRRNLLDHNLIRPARYFLLVSQDKGYVWSDNASAPPDAPPMAEFSMAGVMERYLDPEERSLRLRGPELKMLVAEWLSDLAEATGQEHGDAERALAASGLLDAIKESLITWAHD